MDIQAEKQQICNAIMQRDEEWLITAIKKLLDLDEDDQFTPVHDEIIAQRLSILQSGEAETITLEQLEQDLKAEGKL
jgi:hypothetical protein